MKKEIHPEYKQVEFSCSCGHVLRTGSTLEEDFRVEICSKCHPFYTGEQKIIDTGGRLQRFRDRFES